MIMQYNTCIICTIHPLNHQGVVLEVVLGVASEEGVQMGRDQIDKVSILTLMFSVLQLMLKMEKGIASISSHQECHPERRESSK